MGGRGSSAERSHKNYLGRGNFENLDEYDEEVLNDSQISDSGNFIETVEYSPQQLAGAITQSNNAIKDQDIRRLEASANRLNQILYDGILTQDQRDQIYQQLNTTETALSRARYQQRKGEL